MVQIKPFKGVLYNSKKIRALRKVVAPPYDIISEAMQNQLYNSHRCNIVRLTLGKKTRRDTAEDDRYQRAKTFLRDWMKKKILLKDDRESLYIYAQRYRHNGSEKSRLGFIALMKLEEFSKKCVLPHERIFSKPKRDRLRLIKKVNAHLSPIFSLYHDDNGFIRKSLSRYCKKVPPALDITIGGVRHQLWRFCEKRAVAKIQKRMKRKRIFIADGHHRYSVALAYRDMMRASKHASAEYDYVMMYFTDMNERTLTILPSHRMVKDIKRMRWDTLLDRLSRSFTIRRVRTKKALFRSLAEGRKSARHLFGLYANGHFIVLTLKSGALLRYRRDTAASRAWKQLDVSLLHRFVLGKVLNVSDGEENVGYTRDPDEAIRAVDKKECELAFFLNPAKVSRVKAIAQRGELMPHKSTYFYPKLLTGLVLHTLR